MAALSCYQPCRSHLAQPARCLDEDDFELSTLTIRRRQFIQRCHDTRTGRNRDLIPEVSVRKTREELTKHAVQNALLTRRLNVESGWSKVEEVRKKFEGAAAASYSRSFESPPRRRLADSLFASFKLPRKKDMSAPRSLVPQQKRKSAVELLAESKAFYVKSETVLDRKQEHPLRVSSGLSQAIAAGGCHLVSSGALGNEVCCNPYAATRVIDVRRAAVGSVGVPGGVGGPGGGGGGALQSTLRRLLEHSDSRENVYPPPYVSQKSFSDTRRLKDSYPEREISRSLHTSGTFSGTSSSGTSGSKQKSDDKNRPLSFGDTRVFFPDSFVIPRQRPVEVVIKNTYSIPPAASPQSSGVLGAISPPAEYAHSAHRYVRYQLAAPGTPAEHSSSRRLCVCRSNSHSQPGARDDDGSNINSHKSLPDLHAQAHAYPQRVNVVVGPESVGRSPRRRRHSAHQRTASCSSKGTRSNHSSLMSSCDAFSEHPSPEENYQSYNSRCGSSFARDSGGSSGHYTQRSAPPHAHHDRTRGYSYHTNSGSTLEQCYVSAPPQFQDGAPSPSPPAHYAPPAPPAPPPHAHARVGIHFQASAPPPQFQDEPLYDYNDYDYDCTYKTPLKCLTGGRQDYCREYSRYHEPSTELVSQQPQQQEPRPRRLDDLDYGGADGRQARPSPEATSPLGVFKRQRCLRLKQHKQRRPRLVLRSKSDVSDRYRRSDGRSSSSAPCEGSPPPSPSAESLRLHRFFDYLGMESRQYDAVVRDADADSPVFFSSASTVDSNRVAAAADYTVQGPGVQKQIYRNAEPPSVVERNARIIKWLCQCRKALTQPPQ